MTTNSFVRILLLSVFGLYYLTSCSKDDNDYIDPVGTVTINMMDENNGQTELGNSDVYIDNAHNFYGPYCLLSQLGLKNGLGDISAPVLNGITRKVAVEEGCAYQVFKKHALRTFPSGKNAINVSADYYNVYVVSDITQKEVVVGATVKFVLMDVPDNGLPQPDTYIGSFNKYSWEEQTIEIELPDDDFEYEADISSWINIEHEKKDKKLIVKLSEPTEEDTFLFYIRIGESYTFVYGKIE